MQVRGTPASLGCQLGCASMLSQPPVHLCQRALSKLTIAVKKSTDSYEALMCQPFDLSRVTRLIMVY